MTGMSRKGEALAHAWNRICASLLIAAVATFLATCTTQLNGGAPTPQPSEEAAASASVGDRQVCLALILPLCAPSNAGVAALSLQYAAEMAIAGCRNSNIQLLVKDEGGTLQGAQAGAEQAISEGAEIIIGPLFAQSVSAVGQIARARNIPVIAFSTDASVAARGIYLLSFLPETDVRRIVDF